MTNDKQNFKSVIVSGFVTSICGKESDGTLSLYISREDPYERPLLVKLSDMPPTEYISHEHPFQPHLLKISETLPTDIKIGDRIAIRGRLEAVDRLHWAILAYSIMHMDTLAKFQLYAEKYRGVVSNGKVNEYVEL